MLMRIAIIGAGGIGSALAHLFARFGHRVSIGSRNTESANVELRKLAEDRVMPYKEAAESAELLCFCIPWEHQIGALQLLGDISGKVVIDVSNPETPDGHGLEIGHTMSGAELLAERLPGARVVKAFNYVYAEVLRHAETLRELEPTIFLCGEDVKAKEIVSAVVASCDLQPVDAGPLRNARYLEPLALLMVQLVRKQGWPAGGTVMGLNSTAAMAKG